MFAISFCSWCVVFVVALVWAAQKAIDLYDDRRRRAEEREGGSR